MEDQRMYIIAGLHLLLAHFAYSLATNRSPAPEIAELATDLSAWWERSKEHNNVRE